jgi:hypothetical protein
MMLLWRGERPAAPRWPNCFEAGIRSRVYTPCSTDRRATKEQITRALGDEHLAFRGGLHWLGTNLARAHCCRRSSWTIRPKVRLQLACTLGRVERSRTGQALGRLAVAHHADSFMVAAVMRFRRPARPRAVDGAVHADPGSPRSRAAGESRSG